MAWPRVVGIALGAVIIGHSAAVAQSLPPGQREREARFGPLLANPREPGFFAAYLWGRSKQLGSRLATIGVGQTIALARSENWELAIGAGVFSQFNLESATSDLINTDYLVGFPLTYRRGDFATRFRLYHQSSHLGDEYLLHTGARRTNLTFESAELLFSREGTSWRVYGGGEYAFARSPSDLKPAVVRAGLEYRAARPLVRLGRLATGALITGLDVTATQARVWQPGWSLVGGLEMTTPGSAWHWSLLLKAYTGPTPYGQFYQDWLSSIGGGVSFAR